MGKLRARRRDAAGAGKEFERALELQPDSLDALAGLVALDLAARRFTEARSRIDEALAARPDDPATLMMAGRAATAMTEFDIAEARFRRVIDIEPSHLAAYGSLAQVFIRQGRLDQALAELDQLTERDSRPVAALTLAGMLLDRQGKTAAARERYERALQADPEAAVAANNLAWIYAHSGGNLDIALQLARTAYARLPKTPEVGHTLGVIYYKKELFSDAARTLEATVGLSPENALYHYHLGLAYEKSGDRARAARHLARALALNADFEGASDARALLASLRP
jgi:tetratricopeptide (TPR) repeat protein